jgi:hypothetical protein
MYFAKHETFHIRDGWLTKGLLTIAEEPRIFLDDQAPEELGLGKNMVRALRFWMQATGLADEVFEDSRKVQVATELGKAIRDQDSYLELEGSLWLIHYNLVCSREFATSWYWFFNHYIPTRFTRKDFIERLSQWINVQSDIDKKIAVSSLKKDFGILIKSYLPDPRTDKTPEDIMESPLTTLGLMTSYTETDEDENKKIRVYRYEPSLSENIHPLIFLYVLLDRQNIEREGAGQVGLQTVLRERMNVGRTFNIGLTGFEEILGRLNDAYPDWRITLTRTGGLDQLTLPDVPLQEILKTFYDDVAVASEEVRPWLVHKLT